MEYSKENVMTRKEYLKSKKKSKINFSKLKYVLLFLVILLLGVYVFKQLNVYNNVTKLANKVVEEAALLKTMTMYYVAEPYVKDGTTSVMLYKSLDESRTKIDGSDNLKNIQINSNILYGVRENKLYSIDLETNENNILIEDKITNYVLANGYIYAFEKGKKGLFKYSLEDGTVEKIYEETVYNIDADLNNIYVISEGKTSKSIIKLNLDGNKKTQISNKEIVNDIKLANNLVFYINSADGKLYCMSKSGDNAKKVVDSKINKINNVFVAENNLIYINQDDSNTLHQLDLNTNEDTVLVKKGIEGFQVEGNNIYYKLVNDVGIYKYNLENKGTEKITSIRSKEYICFN